MYIYIFNDTHNVYDSENRKTHCVPLVKCNFHDFIAGFYGYEHFFLNMNTICCNGKERANSEGAVNAI